MTKKFTLGKQERLKSRKSIDALFSKGKSFVVSPFRIIWLLAPEGLQFAVGVSAKNFKKAVDRNNIKRRTREAYRLQRSELVEMLQAKNQGLHVFFTYTAKEISDYQTIAAAIRKGLERLTNMIHETSA